MPTLHALLVGIDNYDGRVQRLRRACDDVQIVHDFLDDYSVYRTNIQVLENSKATRNGLINGFRMFHYADRGDVCLFYFAGHGSKVRPPVELANLERDFESIVCYDSRSAGGYDLTDKELAYLIWEGTRFNRPHFVAITDCCHSGHNTREEVEEGEEVMRYISPNYTPKRADEYYGYRPGRGNYPPKSDHIHVSACSSAQKATDGLFTRYLLHVLKQGCHSYLDILTATRSLMASKNIRHQIPQLYTAISSRKDEKFLGGALGR